MCVMIMRYEQRERERWVGFFFNDIVEKLWREAMHIDG